MLSPTFKTFSGRCRRNRPASSVASAAQLGERTEMGWGKTEMGWGKTEMGWGKSAKGQRWAGERVRKDRDGLGKECERTEMGWGKSAKAGDMVLNVHRNNTAY